MSFIATFNPLSGKRQRLTVSSSAVGFTAANYTVAATAGATKEGFDKKARAAMLQVGADAIYWTVDGSTPSSTVGFESASGDIIYLDSFQKVKEFKAIRKTGDTSIEALFLFGN